MTNQEFFESIFGIPSSMVKNMSLRAFYEWEDRDVKEKSFWKIIKQDNLKHILYECNNCKSMSTKKLSYCPCCGINMEDKEK